jgi:O-antigen/teichoic acid export membrane protein
MTHGRRGHSSSRLPGHLQDPLYRTGYLLLAGAGIGSLLGFAFWTLAAHKYPPRVVGLNSAAISAMILVSGISQLGLGAVLLRYVPAAAGRTRGLVLRSYGLAIGFSLVCGTVAALTSSLWAPSLRFVGHDPRWIAGFALSTAVWSVFVLQDSVITGLQAPHWVPIENSLFSAAKLVLLVALVGVAPVGGPFIAWNAPVGVAVVLITLLIFRRLIPDRRRRATAPFERRDLIRMATGNYLASLLSLPISFLMPVLVAYVTDPATTAYFYAAWLVAGGMQLVALNTASSLTVEGALAETQLGQLLRRSVIHTTWLVAPLSGVVFLAAPVVLRAFGGQYVHAGTPVLRLLALSTIPNAIVALGLAVARVQHRGRLLIAIQAAECIPLFGLTAVLLPAHGIVGVGIAFFASQAAVAFGLLIWMIRPLMTQRPAHAAQA